MTYFNVEVALLVELVTLLACVKETFGTVVTGAGVSMVKSVSCKNLRFSPSIFAPALLNSLKY